MSLLEFFPSPKRVVLAGREYRVSPLRIIDHARIQAWLEEVIPHPYEDHRDRIEGSEGRERKKAILRCQRQIANANYPPRYPSGFASLLFATPEGGRFFFSLILGRDQVITPEEIDHLVHQVTPEERENLDNLLWGGTTQREWELVLSPPVMSGRKDPIDWCLTFAQLAEKYGFTPEQIGNLTIDQFNAYRFGHGRAASKGEDWTKLSHEERQRRHTENIEIMNEIREEEGG